MKRFVSATIAILLAFIQLFALYGCSSKAKNPIIIGEWLKLVNTSFGIMPSDESSPYFSDITSSDTYFNAVQSAADWGIVTSDMEFKTDENLTWSMMVSTLLNAGNFVSETADEETRTEYFRVNFDSSYEDKTGKKDVESDKAIEFLNAAVEKWASFTYEESYADTTYAEDVIDFTSEENDIDYEISPETDTIAVRVSDLGSPDAIQPGDTLIIPANDYNPTDTACVAEKVESPDGEIIYITYSDENADPETVIQEMHVQETVVATPSNFSISLPEGVDDTSDGMTNVRYSPNGTPQASFLDAKASVEGGVEFEFNGFSISFGSQLDDSGSPKFVGKVEADDLIPSEKAKLKSSIDFEISDLKISHKEEINWFKLDYLRLNAEYKSKVTFSIDAGYTDGLFVREGHDNISNSFFTELSSESLKDLDPFSGSADKSRIKIASITLFGANTVAGVTFDVSLVLKIDGSVKVVVEESGNKGIEYKNGRIRTINSTTRDKDLEINVSAECTVNCGPNVYGLGFKILGIEFSFGIGAEAKFTAHLADEENHLLVEYEDNDSSDKMNPEYLKHVRTVNMTTTPDAIEIIAKEQGYNYKVTSTERVSIKVDVCLDISAYFIFKLEITSDSLLAKALQGKFKLDIELLGKDNATVLNIHVDNFDLDTLTTTLGDGASDDHCTLKYKEFEDSAAEDVSPDENGTQVGAERFAAAPLTISSGESKTISFSFIPGGYDVSDFSYTSSATNIASVDSNGKVTGKGAGAATITISTSDGKYSTTCSVVVL